VTPSGAYKPYEPARRPGNRPSDAPGYRVLVHRQFRQHYAELVERVGVQQAQQFWDHLAQTPGKPSPVASIVILRGKAGRPMADGWSRTHHYELTGAARADYQYHNSYVTGVDGDPHPVVAILTLNFSSH
jgi:hypothetical protein